MREISVNDIKKEVARLCVEANLQLSPEMEQCIAAAKEKYNPTFSTMTMRSQKRIPR